MKQLKDRNKEKIQQIEKKKYIYIYIHTETNNRHRSKQSQLSQFGLKRTHLIFSPSPFDLSTAVKADIFAVKRLKSRLKKI